MTRGGKQFYITFIDDYSRYTRSILELVGKAILSACHIQNRIPYKKTVKLLMSPKTFDAMFIGYAENSATYRFTKSENSLIDVNTIIETNNAYFFENIFPMKLNDKSIEPSKFEPRRSKKDRKETNLGDGYYTFLTDEDLRSYKEAITSSMHHFGKRPLTLKSNQSCMIHGS
ncbi:hypothetical protein AAG906_021042 [Vitis piasezkii]